MNNLSKLIISKLAENNIPTINQTVSYKINSLCWEISFRLLSLRMSFYEMEDKSKDW